MNTPEPIVTYADLTMLLNLRDDLLSGRLRAWMDPRSELADLLDRLIAAAEADQPPLPEGWVVLQYSGNGRAVYWHRDGCLYINDGCAGIALAYEVGETIDRQCLTPLRPTITREDVKRAHLAWLKRAGSTLDATRAAFEAAGIEVRDVN